jgi:hypothetical protein
MSKKASKPLTATDKQLGGATGKGFLPGQSGNPGGRRPSLRTAVVRLCGEDGDELVKFWHVVAWGTDAEFAKAFPRTRRTLRDRMDAARELADRGYGKAVQAVEMSGADGSPIQFQEVRESLASKLAGLAARSGAVDLASKPH